MKLKPQSWLGISGLARQFFLKISRGTIWPCQGFNRFFKGHISGAHILKPVGVLQQSMSVQEI